MKQLITILLIFFAFHSNGQTYTTSTLSGYTRSQWKTNDSLRKDITAIQAKGSVKDKNDDLRNARLDSFKQDRDLLFWQTERLNQRATELEKRIEDAGVTLAEQYFVYDSVTKIYTLKPFTITVDWGSNIQVQSKLMQQNESMLAENKKVINKLQATVKKQQKQIDKLTKKL